MDMKTLIFIIFIVLICFCAFKSAKQEKLHENISHNRGKITTFEYRGHSYIAWSINSGGGLVHDPDCKCKEKR